MSSVSDALSYGQLQIAVQKKQLESIEQQGRAALALIDAAQPPPQAAAPSGPPANVPPEVGQNLNVEA